MKPPAKKTSKKAETRASIGHNSVKENDSGARLVQYIERIERLTQEKKDLGTDISEVKSEAKNAGFDVPVIMALVKLRGQDEQKRSEFNSLLHLYGQKIGIDPFS